MSFRRPTGAAFGLRFSLAVAADRDGAGVGGVSGSSIPLSQPPLPPPVTLGPGGRSAGAAGVLSKAILRHR